MNAERPYAKLDPWLVDEHQPLRVKARLDPLPAPLSLSRLTNGHNGLHDSFPPRGQLILNVLLKEP